MKHNAFKKLYSRRGAAMLIALLVFFLAAFSGTIALTMAASNAGRYTHEKDDHQAYLSVMSAANIILDRLTGIEIVCSAPVGYPTPEQVSVSYSIGKGQGDLFLKDPTFESILKSYSVGGAGSPTLEFTLTAGGAPAMGEVHVNLSLKGGAFYFKLYSADGSHRDYQMTMRVGTKFTSGVGNFEKEETDSGTIYTRRMHFDTKNATYTVEEDVSSGGTTE